MISLKNILLTGALLLFLNGCVALVNSGKEDQEKNNEDEEIVLPLKKQKKVTRTLCPPMVVPRLLAAPPSPKSQLSKIDPDDYHSIDRVLVSYISRLKQVINQNNQTIRNAIAQNQKKCRKITY